jgi:NTE family protein
MERERDGRRGPRIGLALSSGGARGFAHVGVLKALRDAGLDIAAVAGSSMGGIMAAGYAVRGDVAELESWVRDFRARDHMRRLLPVMDAGRITRFLDEVLGGARFADCAVPLTVVATDLERRAPVALRDGPVPPALHASMALPFLHRPVDWEGRRLAEGALSCVLPTEQARGPGVDLVIGSLVSREWRRFDVAMAGLSATAGRTVRGWQRHYVEFFRARDLPVPGGDLLPDLAPPTVIIAPTLDKISTVDFKKAREAIAAGEEAATAKLGEIKALLGL